MEILKDNRFAFLLAAYSAVFFLTAIFFSVDYLAFSMLFFLLIFVTVAFLRPFSGLLALLVLRPILDITTSDSLFSLFGFNLNIASLFGVVVIIWATWLAWSNRKHIKEKVHRLGWFWLVFLVSAAFSCLYSINKGASLVELVRLASIFSFFISASLLADSAAKLTRLIKAILVSAVVPVLVGACQIFSGTGLLENGAFRAMGTFAHPNMFAFFLVFILSLSAFAALNLNPRKIAPYWHYIASLALIFVLFFTYTRGAYVALAIFLFVVGLLKFRRFLIIACVFLLIMFFAYSPIRERALSIVSFRSDDSIAWRISLWQETWDYAQPRIFSGYGLGTAPLVIASNKPYYYGSVEPHNDYLRILLEQGIFGLLSYILLLSGLVFALFRRYLSQDKPKLKMFNFFTLAFSVPLFLMSFGDNILNDTALQFAFWSLAGAVLSVQPRKKEAR